jgi:plastocyanin
MQNKLTTMIFLCAAVAGCSSNNTKAADAAKGGSDAPKGSDAKVFNDAPKVFNDAPVVSTVNVVANCTGIGSADIGATITTATGGGDTFNPTAATITAGQYVKFTSMGDHNFANQPGAAANAVFSSGTPGPTNVACLQFTVAGTYPFECIVHAPMMVGTLTVN